LRNNSDFVKLKDEITFVYNYLKIEQLRYPGFILYEVDIPDYLSEEPIPTLLIETFVENSIKHGILPGIPIKIIISAELTEDDEQTALRIRISDNGRGFQDDVLTKVNSGEQIADERGVHIGVWNVSQRLNYLYHGKAKIKFYNLEGHGACIDLIIPNIIGQFK
jgi:two-component system, sensor histidine kinase YesM